MFAKKFCARWYGDVKLVEAVNRRELWDGLGFKWSRGEESV
jgi:hypothetical protein